jgi:23S rRNA pseudouridine1911/1915/1917 synthase
MTGPLKRALVPAEDDGKRLDAALAALLPGMGLRGRRRLCQNGLALVDGRPAPPAHKVRAGQEMSLAGTPDAPPSWEEQEGTQGGDTAFVIRKTDNMAFLHKPAGMHAAALKGSPGSSLEGLLPLLLPGCSAARLLNRLDAPTSGIVAAALDEAGAALYRSAQDSCRTEKRYLALLEGALERPASVRGRILQDGRKRVRVLCGEDPDPARHTLIFPLAVLGRGGAALFFPREGKEMAVPATLAGCIIYKGARHQIRAHAASLGFPLLGDARHGSSLHPACESGTEGERFFLHHARLSLPGTEVTDLPGWLGRLYEAGIVTEGEVLRWLDQPSGSAARVGGGDLQSARPLRGPAS